MSANSSIILTELDFKGLKESLKASLKSQDIFRDYDFEGSSMNVLLDLLAYNTYNNAFYLNMVGSEMWMDSAQLRDSATSHAKDLNYLPRSFVSAEAIINLSCEPDNSGQASVVLPKGTPFTGRSGQRSFTFTTDKNVVLPLVNGKYVAEGISIFEGHYITESHIVDTTQSTLSYRIANKTVDTRSISVTVIEDNGITIHEYLPARSLFGLNDESKVFFVQPSVNDQYEVIFGDGVVGRQPKDNSVVMIGYRASSGELPNGINNFKLDAGINGTTSVAVEIVAPASGGLISESIESIKFNAPRSFTTQERAVTAEDYENLLKINFPEVNVVSAYGGEEADPPQYGKVVLSVDIKGFDGLPRAKEAVYKRFLKERAPLSIDPVFVQPGFIYLAIDTAVKYNINLTGLTPSDITAMVISAILQYRETDLDDFKVTARYSKIISSIDGAHSSLVSNDTNIKAIKYVDAQFNKNTSYDVAFYQAIQKPSLPLGESAKYIEASSVYSSAFIADGKTCYLTDDGAGKIRLVSMNNAGDYVKMRDVGTVNYETGFVQINSLNIARLLSTAFLKIYAKTALKDIASNKNIILTIREEDITVAVEQIRE